MRSILTKVALALVVVILAIVGVIAWAQYSNTSDLPFSDTVGKDPKLVEPDPQWIPSVKLVETVGWAANEAPKAGQGLAVARFAEGLDHPRTMLTLPNGDVLVTETNAPAGNKPKGLTGMVMGWMFNKVAPVRLRLTRSSCCAMPMATGRRSSASTSAARTCIRLPGWPIRTAGSTSPITTRFLNSPSSPAPPGSTESPFAS
nr:hypothetical protein [Novosphingobium sp. ST904]